MSRSVLERKKSLKLRQQYKKLKGLFIARQPSRNRCLNYRHRESFSFVPKESRVSRTLTPLYLYDVAVWLPSIEKSGKGPLYSEFADEIHFDIPALSKAILMNEPRAVFHRQSVLHRRGLKRRIT